MTAEGDNSVLMQKVVKDLLTHARKGQHIMPKIKKDTIKQIAQMEDIGTMTAMKTLIYHREQVELKGMMKLLQNLVVEKENKFFDVWMYMVSDEIISLAKAFGERFFLQSAVKAIEDECLNEGAKAVLLKVLHLHMSTYLTENMTWYLQQGLVTRIAAKNMVEGHLKAVKALAPHVNELIEAFGLSNYQEMHSPAARDYIAFNAQKDSDNFRAAGPIFDATKGATQKNQYRPRM